MAKLDDIITFNISETLCGFLILQFMLNSEKARRLDRATYNGKSTFDLIEVDEGSSTWNLITKELEPLLNCKFVHLRIHQWEPTDKAAVHVDNIHPGCDTMILRLDSYEGSRLRVKNKLVHEEGGFGYLLPEGTPHEVVPGKEYRYTLVGWCEQQ